MSESKELATTNSSGGGALMVADMVEQVNTIQLAMKSLMKDGVHYGKIPGCGDKPALLKPGAEKIAFMFKLAPKFEKEVDELGGGHREIIITTKIYDNKGNFLGEGLGSCSTHESKYRWRNAGKPCPECKFVGSIFRSKTEFGGGYYCNGNKGGCGKSFKAGTAGCKAIDGMTIGKVENPDIADQYNTVLKMAKKRSLVDAILTVTAASDVFEQDLDEFSEAELEEIRSRKNAERGKPRTEPPKATPAPKKQPAAKKAPATPKPEQVPEPATDPTFSFEEYKNMANELASENGDLGAWWVGICSQAMKDVGVKKYDMLQKYLTGALGMALDDGAE